MISIILKSFNVTGNGPRPTDPTDENEETTENGTYII